MIEDFEIDEMLNKENFLTIDKSGKPLITDKKSKINEVEGTEKIPKEKKVIVHTTSFFPKNHMILTDYDGKKKKFETYEYDGEKKVCETIMHRHTCHFTINNRVKNTGDGAGNWDDKTFMIIDQYSEHEKQIISEDPSDSFIWGNMHLSDKAIILVREDAYEDIPQNELTNFKIIKYQGDPEDCLQNFISGLGYDIIKTDARAAGHEQSLERLLEKNLCHRDLAINFLKNNEFIGQKDFELTPEEIFEVFQISQANSPITSKGDVTVENYLDKCLNKNFARFIIFGGFQLNENGKFSIKDDNEIYEIIKKLIPTFTKSYFTKAIIADREYAKGNRNSAIKLIEEYSQIQSRNLEEINIDEIDQMYLSCVPLEKLQDEEKAKMEELIESSQQNNQFAKVKLDFKDFKLVLDSKRTNLMPLMTKNKYKTLKELFENEKYIQNLEDSRLVLACDFTECKTAGELIKAANKYVSLFDRYVSGEDIKFDNQGNIIEKKPIAQNDFIVTRNEMGKAVIVGEERITGEEALRAKQQIFNDINKQKFRDSNDQEHQ